MVITWNLYNITLYLHRFSIITRIIILNLEKAVQDITLFLTFSITTGIRPWKLDIIQIYFRPDWFYLKINIGAYPDCPRNARKVIVPWVNETCIIGNVWSASNRRSNLLIDTRRISDSSVIIKYLTDAELIWSPHLVFSSSDESLPFFRWFPGKKRSLIYPQKSMVSNIMSSNTKNFCKDIMPPKWQG